MANRWPAPILRFRSVLTDHMPIRHIGIIAIDIIIGTGIIDIGTERERTNREAKTVALEQCRSHSNGGQQKASELSPER